MSADEHVVLLDPSGAAIGTAPKGAVHQERTPLHLAFSCYLFDADDRLLLTQRALDKATFPGLWTNTACGHPAPGESGPAAAVRRARDELGIRIDPPRLVLPGFRYRAAMDGIEEHEWCPVYVGRVAADAPIRPDPAEVHAVDWIAWSELVARVLDGSASLSPWSRDQVRALAALGPSPAAWPEGSTAQLPAALRVA